MKSANSNYTTFSISKALEEGTWEHEVLMADIAEIAKQLTKLKKISVLNQIENAYILSKRNKTKSISNDHNYNYDFIDIKIINKDYLFIIGDDKLQLYSAIDCNLLDTFNINGEIVSSEIIDDKIIISLSLNDNNSMLQLYEIKNNKCLYIQQSQQKIKRMLNYF